MNAVGNVRIEKPTRHIEQDSFLATVVLMLYLLMRLKTCGEIRPMTLVPMNEMVERMLVVKIG